MSDAIRHLIFSEEDPERRYWTIHGRQYDLSSFIDKHPGGRCPLRLTRGRDCTALFESYHSLSELPHQMLERFAVDAPSPHPPSPFDWENTPFYDDLKQRVRAHFQGRGRWAHKMPLQGYLWFGFLHVLFGLSVWRWLAGDWWTLVAMPVLYWIGFAHLLHSGTHWAVSRRPWVNTVAGHLGTYFTAPAVWLRQHVVAHHAYTNMPGRDPDLYHFNHPDVPFFPSFRMHPSEPRHPTHARWPLGLFLVPGMATFAIAFLYDLAEHLSGRLAEVVSYGYADWLAVAQHVSGRLLLAAAVFGPPFWLHPFPKALAFAVIPTVVHGILVFSFTQVSHIAEHCMVEPDGEWATHQVRATSDYAPASFPMWVLSLGTNLQVTHHLFPQIDSWHLKALVRIVEETCRDHGVPYSARPTWRAAMADTVRHLDRLNRPPPETDKDRNIG